MKKYIISIVVAAGMVASFQLSAATGSGVGCGVWGKVTYLYQSASNQTLAIINGGACIISGATARDVSVMSAVLSQAEASNKNALIQIGAAGVNVAMQP